MPTKARFKTSSCPLDKWEAVITAKDLKKIQAFLDEKDKTIEGLQELSNKYLSGTKVSTCPSCNRNMINELKAIIRNADT